MMTLDEALKYCITQTSELRDRVAYVDCAGWSRARWLVSP